MPVSASPFGPTVNTATDAPPRRPITGTAEPVQRFVRYEQKAIAREWAPICYPFEPVTMLRYPTARSATRGEPSTYWLPTTKPASITYGNVSTPWALLMSSCEPFAGS